MTYVVRLISLIKKVGIRSKIPAPFEVSNQLGHCVSVDLKPLKSFFWLYCQQSLELFFIVCFCSKNKNAEFKIRIANNTSFYCPFLVSGIYRYKTQLESSSELNEKNLRCDPSLPLAAPTLSLTLPHPLLSDLGFMPKLALNSPTFQLLLVHQLGKSTHK